MSAMINFAFEEKLVRVVEIGGEHWFIGKDVCAALGIQNHNDALKRLEDDERAEVGITDPSGTKYAIAVSQPGVYQLTFTSRRPEAKRFKRWLAHEVLPQIQKTGSYQPSNPDPVMTPQQMDIRLALDMVREARLIHGKQRAARLWESLPMLPRVPEIPVLQHANHAAGAACLAHLLAYRIETGESVAELITLAMEENEPLDSRLRDLGIRPITEGEPGIAIANNPACTRLLFRDTIWDKGRHIFALKTLPGATSFQSIRFGGHAVSRATFIPAELLEET
ncbi:hypothetical protein GOZ93_00865 [Agrobacterium vitis]|uniref:BRO-N domain-containing protein n=1 Tax=Agrobacterium vitis TaxID=373 RepID=UPI0012E7F004|nr:BRO family protein [Agrobacterium vitis]MUZ80789.1 hypothetical protein [Agrobacterium vitis]